VSAAAPGFILTVSGLAREAAIARGPGVRTLVAGGPRLPRLIEAAIAEGAAGILSFGIAGGLDTTLPPGTAILAGRSLPAASAGRPMRPGGSVCRTAPMQFWVIRRRRSAGHVARINALGDGVGRRRRIGSISRPASPPPTACSSRRWVIRSGARAIPPAAIAGMREGGRIWARSCWLCSAAPASSPP
jgi:hypothetical protein